MTETTVPPLHSESRLEAQGQADSIPKGPEPAGFREQLFPTLVSVPLLTLLTGVAFPLLLGLVANQFFPHQAGGSLIERDGLVIGSELIGQPFRDPRYFHPRPSAAGDGYDAKASGGTNLGPNHGKLHDGAKDDPATPDQDESFTGVRQLAEEYRRLNGLPSDTLLPIDAVTRSGSGLDPHISPANASLQAPRVARARGLPEAEVRSLVAEHTNGQQFGVLGEPRVAVLPLNLALDRAKPPTVASRRSGHRRSP